MNANQIRYFVTICQVQSFTRAAQRCGVSQPSISNAIRRLEEEFGGVLFHRTRNGIKLSFLGSALQPHLDRMNQSAEKAARVATNLTRVKLNSVKLNSVKNARPKGVRPLGIM